MLRCILTLLLALLCASASGQIRTPEQDPAPAMHLLGAADPLTREHAAQTLAALGPAAAPAVEPLLHCFRDPDAYVQGAAASALAAIGPAALDGLIAALRDTAAEFRWCAAIGLGKMGAKALEAVPALAAALADPESNVRWCAASALSRCGDRATAAVPALRAALADADADVRWAAAHALQIIAPAEWARSRPREELKALVDSLTPALMKELHVPGAAVAFISDGEVLWSAQYGVADVRSGEPVTEHTLFEAASMSKPVFCCAVMRLAEQAGFDIDRPLTEYVAEADLPAQPERNRITGRMIMSHTSGLPNWRKGEEERDGPLPVLFPPGTRFGYSGEGMFALQRAVEHQTGEPLDVWTRRTVFEPLGLKASSFAWTESLDRDLAAGHDEKGSFLLKTKYVHPNAAYTLYTTAREYATFLAGVMKPGLLVSRSSLEAMLAYQVHVDVREPIERPGNARGNDVWWGLGWSINSTPSGDIFHHSGANRSGFRCYSQFSPARRTGLVIMTNGFGGGELWTRLVSAVGDI